MVESRRPVSPTRSTSAMAPCSQSRPPRIHSFACTGEEPRVVRLHLHGRRQGQLPRATAQAGEAGWPHRLRQHAVERLHRAPGRRAHAQVHPLLPRLRARPQHGARRRRARRDLPAPSFMWCCVSEENATSNFAAIDASLGDATGEGVAARGLATRGARAASSAVALGFSGEAEKPREEGKLMLSSADEGPGDDDAVEEPTPRTVQLRILGGIWADRIGGALAWSSLLSSRSRDRSILHHDIRAQEDYVSKLTGHKSEDYGASQCMSAIAGSYGYIAPDCYLVDLQECIYP
ncbi:uncharacterized protein [Zea mays]|uniref:uncharacterized protein isoform X2 n=1 Tax=Zea mays TaxID=4577 RepID=UPI0004DEB19E|nr:uncharacterized protein LOC100216863 isoform X2 [Zea mays]|eukprot:XP_008647449.1 uncharacterized protein LOC100216863 isoform X2 [Zea mays]